MLELIHDVAHTVVPESEPYVTLEFGLDDETAELPSVVYRISAEDRRRVAAKLAASSS